MISCSKILDLHHECVCCWCSGTAGVKLEMMHWEMGQKEYEGLTKVLQGSTVQSQHGTNTLDALNYFF